MRLWRIVCARSHQSARASAPGRPIRSGALGGRSAPVFSSHGIFFLEVPGSQPCHGLVTRSEGCPRFQREESPPGPGRDHGEQCSAVCSLACSTHIRTFLNYHVSVPIYTHATCNEPFAHSNVFLPSLPWVLFYFCAPSFVCAIFCMDFGGGCPEPQALSPTPLPPAQANHHTFQWMCQRRSPCQRSPRCRAQLSVARPCAHFLSIVWHARHAHPVFASSSQGMLCAARPKRPSPPRPTLSVEEVERGGANCP